MRRNSHTILIVLFFLSACTQPEAAIQPATATHEATATLEPTPSPTPFPELKVAETPLNAGGAYSEEQLAVMDSEGFKEKVAGINDWWLYWAYGAEDQQPFLTELTNIHIVPFFEEENPESYSLAIEVKMDDGEWHTFLLPIDTSKAEFRQYPPVEFGSDGIPLETEYDIPEGFGPLDLKGDIRWTKSLGWVRLDESGEMVEAINMETGQWEKDKVLPQEFLDKLPEGYAITNGQILVEAGVELGTIKTVQGEEGYNLAFTALDASGTLQNYETDLSSFLVHPAGALLIDNGERVGFVWKGDRWTEILLDIKFETDGGKLNEFPTIFYDDITSGRLAEAERLVAQPFPKGVEPLDNYYYDPRDGSVYPEFYDPYFPNIEASIEFSKYPETFPMRFVYFYQMEINKIPTVVATLQVLNKDYSSIFIHMVESKKSINSDPDYWNKTIQLQRRPRFDLALGKNEDGQYDYCKDGWSEVVKEVACFLNGPKRDELQKAAQKLGEEQKIPEEFEEVLSLFTSGLW